MNVNNDNNIKRDENNPFLNPEVGKPIDAEVDAVAQQALNQAIDDVFSHNPFEGNIVTNLAQMDDEPLPALPATPQGVIEEDHSTLPLPPTPQLTQTAKPLPPTPQEIIFPKGEKARSEFIEQIKDPNFKMNINTMVVLYKMGSAKLAEPTATSPLGKIGDVVKKIMTKAFASRESQLNEINQTLLQKINIERKKEGLRTLNNLIEKLNKDESILNGGAFILSEGSSAVSSWMHGLRDEKEFDVLMPGEKVAIVMQLTRENLSLKEDEVNLTRDDLEGGKLKNEVGEQIRAKMFENNPNREVLFQFLKDIKEARKLDSAQMARVCTASLIPQGEGPHRKLVDFESMRLVEWLIQNPGS